MGLQSGTAVAAGMIDAHAGGIGTVGIGGRSGANLAYVFGTSSCTMTSTIKAVFVPGVWGPYYSAMVPGMWLNEGGQSAAGAAFDRLHAFHPAAVEAHGMAEQRRVPLPVLIANAAAEKAGTTSEAVRLATGLHVVPEFLGNRAPFADPHARAVIAGLGMERDFHSLVAPYVAGLSVASVAVCDRSSRPKLSPVRISKTSSSAAVWGSMSWSDRYLPTPVARRWWGPYRKSRFCLVRRSLERSQAVPFRT